MSDPTPLFGITERTRKPVARAASEVSQMITALERHQAIEREVFASNAGRLAAAANADPDARFSDGQLYSWHNMRLEGIASELRSQRDEMIAQLLPLRALLAELLVEAQTLLPEGALLHANVEPRPTERAPEAIMGVELTVADNLNVLLQTLQWTKRVGRGLSVCALGPTYTLLLVVEHFTSEAKHLRDSAQNAYDEFLREARRS